MSSKSKADNNTTQTGVRPEPRNGRGQRPRASASAGKSHENGKATLATASTDEHHEAEAQDFFEKVGHSLTNRLPDAIISIPIWGHQGHGKTTALLTAYKYCRPDVHAIGLALIKDTDPLRALSSTYPEYAALSLASLAEDTRYRVNEESKRFFQDNEWPAGTDEPTPYLFQVRTMSRSLGYLFAPDIRGGSFEEHDSVAKNALEKAHGIAIVVDPAAFEAETHNAKEYQDAVLSQIQWAAKEAIPALVLLTKADLHAKERSTIDSAKNRISAWLLCQAESFASFVTEVSVVGDDTSSDTDNPAPYQARKPDALIRAWVWLLSKAMAPAASELRKRVPTSDLAATRKGGTAVSASAISEVRLKREESAGLGTVLTGLVGANTPFLFLADDSLVETRIVDGGFEEGTSRTLSAFDVEKHVIDAAFGTGGSTFAGAQEGQDVIWYGATGQSLRPSQLPVTPKAWVPLGEKTLAVLDESGALHILVHQRDGWTGTPEFVKEFVPAPPAGAALAYGDGLITCHTGASVRAVKVTSRHKLGDQADPNIKVRHPAETICLNHRGFVAVVGADLSILAGRETQHLVGKSAPKAPIALSPVSGRLAWIDAQMRLKVTDFEEETPVTSKLSPTLNAIPSGLVWSADGTVLALSFDDGRCAWATTYGF